MPQSILDAHTNVFLDFQRLSELNEKKWVVFQTHTITLSNRNILWLQSFFLTVAINFVNIKEKTCTNISPEVIMVAFYFKFETDPTVS